MEKITVIEEKGQRVLTSKQLALAYEAETIQIQQNFSNNKSRFLEGKHYLLLTGDELRRFKSDLENFEVVPKTINRLYLWTEKGALLHAKSLNTDKTWEVYDYLVDFYFRAKGQPREEKQLPIETSEMKRRLQEGMEEFLHKKRERYIGYCQGAVLGVLEREMQEKGGDEAFIMAIYGMLSERGKAMVLDMLFEEKRHEQ